MRRLLPALLILLLSSCVTANVSRKAEPLFLKSTDFRALPGWTDDNAAAALPALQKSCAAIADGNPASAYGPAPFAGTYADWQGVCGKIPGDTSQARRYFEDNFTPYEIRGATGRDGLFTGYYEPVLHGSLTRKAPYLIPIYARPADLVSVDLGAFRPELKGETIMGRVADQRLVPYFTRADIDHGALKKTPKVVWVDNAVDAFFLHIQGSGEVVLPHGRVLQVGYAAANGRAYTAIGRELVKRGALDRKDVSMQSIRAWLEAHPEQAPAVMDVDESFVFFRKLDTAQPLGAQGVELTPGRSLAVDRKLIPYGAPVWLDAEAPGKNGRLRHLMIAQDTGGAITGAVRGDFFWGAGAEAASNAGIMKSKGQDYLLLPKTVTVPGKYNIRPWWMPSFLDFGAGTDFRGVPPGSAYNP